MATTNRIYFNQSCSLSPIYCIVVKFECGYVDCIIHYDRMPGLLLLSSIMSVIVIQNNNHKKAIKVSLQTLKQSLQIDKSSFFII